MRSLHVSRRGFLKSSTLAIGAATVAFPYVSRGRVLGANGRVNVACIGVGGKGDSDSTDASECGGNIVALCDVDKGALASKVKEFAPKFPDLKLYRDYRKMFDEMGDGIDAVTISIPDHHHGGAAVRALSLGKHCFCQKPLCQTVHEIRLVRQLAKDKGVATQMGNQGSAADGLRRGIEVIQAGVIGNPLELHVWCNRPIWPTGMNRPAGEDPIPADLDWDLWIGPAQPRPFKEGFYHPNHWRGWFDFGTGALGDMACHTVNMPFRALKLGYPNVVECELSSRMYSESFPITSRIRFDFPERDGLPPVKFWWYDGNPNIDFKPLRPDAEPVHEIVGMYGKLPTSGALIVGEKGKVFSPDDYGTEFFVLLNGEENYVSGAKHEACKAVPQTIARSPGHMQEWFRMMKDGTPSYSNFGIASYLAEVILLGCIAQRVGEGSRMEWDGPNTRSPNLASANEFVKRDNRAGWEVG